MTRPSGVCAVPQRRATGRTTSQLEKLLPGDVYIVHSRSLADYVRRLAAVRIPTVAPHIRIYVVRSADDLCFLLRGLPCRAVADHACPPAVVAAAAAHTSRTAHLREQRT